MGTAHHGLVKSEVSGALLFLGFHGVLGAVALYPEPIPREREGSLRTVTQTCSAQTLGSPLQPVQLFAPAALPLGEHVPNLQGLCPKSLSYSKASQCFELPSGSSPLEIFNISTTHHPMYLDVGVSTFSPPEHPAQVTQHASCLLAPGG